VLNHSRREGALRDLQQQNTTACKPGLQDVLFSGTDSPKMPAAACSASVFQHIFWGWEATYSPGRYPYDEFVQHGALDNDASSIIVYGAGCTATLYGDNLGGWEATFPEGRHGYEEFAAHGAVDNSASSIIVRQPETPATTGCIDTPGWHNRYGTTCTDYLTEGRCSGGFVVPGEGWATGDEFARPEENCCACGRERYTAAMAATPAASPLSPPPRPSPPPSPPSPPPAQCLPTLEGDFSQAECEGWCSPQSPTEHCKWCKCRGCDWVDSACGAWLDALEAARDLRLAQLQACGSKLDCKGWCNIGNCGQCSCAVCDSCGPSAASLGSRSGDIAAPLPLLTTSAPYASVTKLSGAGKGAKKPSPTKQLSGSGKELGKELSKEPSAALKPHAAANASSPDASLPPSAAAASAPTPKTRHADANTDDAAPAGGTRASAAGSASASGVDPPGERVEPASDLEAPQPAGCHGWCLAGAAEDPAVRIAVCRSSKCSACLVCNDHV